VDIKLMATKQERFEALLAEHAGVVFRVARTYAHHPEDLQDLAQEIRVQLWRGFPKYDARRPFATWMYRIALNVAISWRRKASHLSRRSLALDDVPDLATSTDFGDEARVANRILEELDPLNRALLLLYLEDLSYAEIGEVLGITPNNVATKISRLKDRFRKTAQEG